MFRDGGLETPDFSAVRQAALELTPTNMSIRTTEDNFTSMTYTTELYRNDLNLPIVSITQRARVTVNYRFLDGRAVVTSSKYEPYSLE
jgi:hypothetical protein